MMLMPGRRMRAHDQKQGLGADTSKPNTDTFNWMFSVGLSKIRMNNITPLYWHRTEGASIKKANNLMGPLGRRVVHVMAAVGKAFYASLLSPLPTSSDHGFFKHRRREDAVLAALVTSWRVRQAGWTHALTLKDMANAFGSSDWSEVDETVRLSAAAHDQEICQQRYRNAVITLEALEGDLLV